MFENFYEEKLSDKKKIPEALKRKFELSKETPPLVKKDKKICIIQLSYNLFSCQEKKGGGMANLSLLITVRSVAIVLNLKMSVWLHQSYGEEGADAGAGQSRAAAGGVRARGYIDRAAHFWPLTAELAETRYASALNGAQKLLLLIFPPKDFNVFSITCIHED